ncbi:response regulator transcription factor [Meridianimarinicoccus aquatilis]|uniref:Response regulator n=1 Tax=Meridianimarinicoccus aquatilis TaxID=2552766 RepID=A0A4R6AXJ2_9RHOB|nr:response regulator [Fluviibacterium aquatile]QIE41848.1 response regulator [Rhodobacteraceae bacterium SC52]TDL89441.1 response regulator [Fluviibacterium aquatile]
MGHHVLLIEDEPNIMEAIRFFLSRDGWKVSCHSDGATAMAEIRRVHPDVVVLDVMLPNRSGFDVLRDLRSDNELSPIPVLMLTAKGQAKDRSRAEDLGASDFMTKPFSNAEVRDKLRALVAPS